MDTATSVMVSHGIIVEIPRFVNFFVILLRGERKKARVGILYRRFVV